MTPREKAAELMALAMGVGISNNQSIDLMAAKLEEWEAPPATSEIPPFAWAYTTHGGRSLRLTFSKTEADQSADAFRWDNPRVRKVRLTLE